MVRDFHHVGRGDVHLHPTPLVAHKLAMQATVVVIFRNVEIVIHATRLLGVDISDERVDEQRHLLLGHILFFPVVVVDVHDAYVLHLTE